MKILSFAFLIALSTLAIAKDSPLKPNAKWNGFDRCDFTLAKSKAKAIVVVPEKPSAGTPWIWRARFFGHQPALDLALDAGRARVAALLRCGELVIRRLC